MKVQELKDIIASLAKSQGYYWRLYRQLDADKSWNSFKRLCNEAKCKTSLDVVLFIEQ